MAGKAAGLAVEVGRMLDADGEELVFETYGDTAGASCDGVQRFRLGPAQYGNFLILTLATVLHANESGAAYIRLTHEKVAGTRAIGDTVNVDYDEHGEAVGIEVLGPVNTSPPAEANPGTLTVTHVKRDRYEAGGGLSDVDVTFDDYEAAVLGPYSHCLVRRRGRVAARAYGMTRREAFVNAQNDLARQEGFPE